ncbi:MAG TPA: ABC transporter permease [Acidimicrobiia bacterium]|nr:ABC transporter permease [Acidimicrobiia bacterium]
MKVLTIAWTNLRRMLRERSNIFFVFIFPLAIILLIGAQFGGGVDPAVGLHQADDGRLGTAIVEEIEAEEDLDTFSYDTRQALVTAVERGSVQAGVLIPAGIDSAAAAGEHVEIGFLARPDGSGRQLQQVVTAAIADVVTPVTAAQFAVEQVDAGFVKALGVAQTSGEAAPGVAVETTAVGDALFPDTLGQFDLGASSMLVLFVFLTALAGSSALILTRQLGISRRMLSTPTPIQTIVVGEGTGRWATALLQGLYIVLATVLLFQVNWGDPLAAALLLVVFAAVGAGAGMLAGATFKNEQQAGGVGVVLSLGLAALGGCMFPLELFSPTMQRIAHLTPHAWALDGFAELVRRGGTVVDILPELGVLTAYAAVLFLLAGRRLRTVLTR